MTRWICTRCGGSEVKALESRPSLDDRFAVGTCARCTPPPVFDPRTARYKPLSQATVPLAADTDKTHDDINRRDRLAREKKLVEKHVAGDPRLTDADHEEAVAVQRRWAEEAELRRSA